MVKRMPQRYYFNEIITLAKANDRQDLVEFAESRIEVLDKKSAYKKPTKVQVENEGYKNSIRSTLATVDNGVVDNGVTVTELQKLDDTLGTLSNQRVSALLRQMVEAGEVVRTVEKKKSYFSLASANEVERE